MGEDYCLLTLQIIVNQEAYCSENILCFKNTRLIPETKFEKDRFGNLLDPIKHRFIVDPSKFIDLSSKTIMPIFNENSFVFFLETKEFMQSKTQVVFELYVNLTKVCAHTMEISRYLN